MAFKTVGECFRLFVYAEIDDFEVLCVMYMFINDYKHLRDVTISFELNIFIYFTWYKKAKMNSQEHNIYKKNVNCNLDSFIS